MNATDFYRAVTDRLGELARAYALQMPGEKGFVLRMDGPEVFVTVAYDVSRSREVVVSIGLQKGLTHPVERPFEMAELLRAMGQYELPEAKDEIVAIEPEVGQALSRVAELLGKYGTQALRGDRDLFRRLDEQRDLDCRRYAYERPLLYASRAAFEAWSKGDRETVVSLLRPFRDRLTESERSILDAAEGRSGPRL